MKDGVLLANFVYQQKQQHMVGSSPVFSTALMGTRDLDGGIDRLIDSCDEFHVQFPLLDDNGKQWYPSKFTKFKSEDSDNEIDFFVLVDCTDDSTKAVTQG